MWRNGRRARLRGVWGNPCGFKSRHRQLKKSPFRALFYCRQEDAEPQCEAFLGFSGFADGRHERSELVRIANRLSRLSRKAFRRNSVSVEQIQDSPAIDIYLIELRSFIWNKILQLYLL